MTQTTFNEWRIDNVKQEWLMEIAPKTNWVFLIIKVFFNSKCICKGIILSMVLLLEKSISSFPSLIFNIIDCKYQRLSCVIQWYV